MNIKKILGAIFIFLVVILFSNTSYALCGPCGQYTNGAYHSGCLSKTRSPENDSKHYVKCCCGYIGSTESHTYNVASANCLTAKKCTACGYIADYAYGHKYNMSEPTCEEGIYCTRTGCSATKSALGHSYTNDCYSKHCTSNVCSRCGEHETGPCIQCNTSGYCQDCEQNYCDICGHVCTACKPHDWVDNGEDEKCTKCQETRSHIWGEWGAISRTCILCGAIEYGGLRVHIIESDLVYSFTQNAGNEVTLTSKVGDLINLAILSGNTEFFDEGKFIMPATDVTINARKGNYEINTDIISYTSTLAEAVALAESGNTITLISDVTDNTPVIIPAGKNLTLALANNTITTHAGAFITVEGTLTISGTTGGIQSLGSEKVVDVKQGSLYVDGVNISISADRAHGIVVGDSANVIVVKGSIVASGSKGYGIRGASNSTIILGVNSDEVLIEGGRYGVFSSGVVNYYGGTVRGSVQSIHASVTMLEGKAFGETKVGDIYQSEIINAPPTDGLTDHFDGRYTRTDDGYKSSSSVFEDQCGGWGLVYGATWNGDKLTFDGTNDYATLGTRSYATPTVEVDLEFNALSGDSHIFSNYVSSNGYGIKAYSDGRVNAYMYKSGTNYAAVCTAAQGVKVGERCKVAMTYNGSNIILYINGVSVATKATTAGNSTSVTEPLTLGKFPSNSSQWLSGSIYSVKIYDRALSADEILQSYNGTHITNGLVGYFDARFNQGTYPKYSGGYIFDMVDSSIPSITSVTYSDDNALVFNGSSSWVKIGERNYANPTLEVVFASDVVPTAAAYICANIQSGGYGMYINGTGHITGTAHIGSGYVQPSQEEQIEAGRKYHAVLTYDNTNVRLYVDGVEVAAVPATAAMTTTANSTVLAMGNNPNGTAAESGYFDGKIYMVKVYDRALTAAEVADAYNAYNKGKKLIDIHEGGTAYNDGKCRLCGVQYLGYPVAQ